MGYRKPLGGVTRRISPDIVTHSVGFSLRSNLGGRVAFIKLKSGRVVIWSSVPYGDEVKNALSELTGETDESNFGVAYLVVPDIQHNLVAKQYKAKFPGLKLIGGEHLTAETAGVGIDFQFKDVQGNRVISHDELVEMGFDEEFANDFEFVYLKGHRNYEIVTYFKSARTIFEADVLFNLVCEGSEQFSVASGYPEGYQPNTGWFGYYVIGSLIPESIVGRFMMNRVFNRSHVKENREGLSAVMKWDFDSCVLSHGNILEGDAKEKFRLVFGDI